MTTDTFTITASNGVHTATELITVPVDAGQPVMGTVSVGTPDPAIGVVSGTAGFTDLAGRTLIYSSPTTSAGGGTVKVNSTTGAFTYIPTFAQRLSADTSTTDTFTVTADNGVHTTSETVTVSVVVPTPITAIATLAINHPISGSVRVSPDGSTVYFGGAVQGGSPGKIWTLDTATRQLGAGISLGSPSGGPSGLTVSPDGRTLYVINTNDGYTSARGRVIVISASTGDIIKNIAVGSQPQGVAVSPDGSSLYVSNVTDRTVTVISTVTNEVTDTIQLVVRNGLPGGYQPQHLVVSPDGSRVYVVNPGGMWGLTLIETATNTMIDNLGYFDLYDPRPNPPNRDLRGALDLAFSSDGSVLAVSSDDKISFIDPATNTITSVVADVNCRCGLAFSSDGRYLYAANNDVGIVSIISMDTYTVTNTVDVGNSPTGISVNPVTGEIYVVNTGDGTMSVITP